MEFSFYRIEGGAQLEVVANFKYLGQPLYQTDDDYPMV